MFFSACVKSEVRNSGEPRARAERNRTSYITLIAAGDNLINDIIYNRARVDDERSFDFDPSYTHIKSIIQSADIAFVNQESMMGGTQFGYSGFPMFNSPQQAGLGILNAGFTVINLAHNHAMDRGERVVFGTMDFFDSHEIMYLGVFRTEEIRNNERRIIDKNGIKVGFLAYSYSLNGFALPRDKPWLVAVTERAVMAREINNLRPHCDLLVVSLHWGDEFSDTVNSWQRDLVAFMAEHNVDLILGHHPHVTAPLETVQRPDGGQLTVFYSLGDFLSHTHSRSTPNTITGALAYIRIKKTWDNNTVSTVIDYTGVIPTVSHYSRERTPFVVYPLWDYTDELASVHAVGTIFGWNWGTITVNQLYSVANRIFPGRVIDKNQYEELQNYIVQNSRNTGNSRRNHFK